MAMKPQTETSPIIILLLRHLIVSIFVLSLAVLSFQSVQAQTPTWNQIIPLGSPPTSRSGHSAVYDAVVDKMIVFGGANCCGGIFNEVWVLSSASGAGGTPSWTPSNPTGSLPVARGNHTAVYDSTTNRMIVFGGAVSGLGNTNEVWILSNANGSGGTPTWTQLAPLGSLPQARALHSAIYDPSTNRMIIFGGSGSSGTFNDLWILSNANGLGGTPTWAQLNPSGGGPVTRFGHTAVYDPITNRMIVFGGAVSGGGSDLNDFWILTNANGNGGTPSWEAPTFTGAAPLRWSHTAIYDSNANSMLIFGGALCCHTGPINNDLWKVTDANAVGAVPSWTQVAPSGTLPGTRIFHTAAYDQSTDSMIIFGGLTSGCSACYNDVWVLSDALGGPLPPSEVPVVLVHGICGDPGSFGSMADLLTSAGVTVAPPFNYGLLSGNLSDVRIEELATLFAGHIRDVLANTGANQVDVVAHSMGGLIVRAWMAGLVTVPVPYEGQIRRLISVGTPNYGIRFLFARTRITCSVAQAEQLTFGSEFLWELHDQWQSFRDSSQHRLPSENLLFIAGTQSTGRLECNGEGCNDGGVEIASAILPDTLNERVRYVPYKHSSGLLPRGVPALVEATDSEHHVFRLVNAFLSDGTVLSQCCGPDTLGYIPPHQQGAVEQEGLLFIRTIDATTGQRISRHVRLRLVPNVRFQSELNAGTVTAWGVNAAVYTVTVCARGYEPTQTVTEVKVARPTVLTPVQLRRGGIFVCR
jgi:pimeloyl-ACP methyl ester carboxylesterase